MGNKSEEFFVLPNTLVDDLMEVLGTRGVALYVCLARCTSLLDYPSKVELSGKLKISTKKVEELLKKLRGLKLLNDKDLEVILGKEFE